MPSAVAADESTRFSPRSFDHNRPDLEEGDSTHAGLLRRPLCLVTSTIGDAALLQQFIHLTRIRDAEWIRRSIGELAHRFDRPASTIRDGLGRLEERGFLSSHHQPGCAKSYRLERDVVLEAIRAQGLEMTEEALMGTGELDYTCRGPSNERTSPTVPLRPPLCLITPSLLDAALLQQLVYLTNKRGEDGWVRVDAEYLGSPFDVATQTIRDHLGRLERAGFVSSRRPRTNGAKEYRIEHDVVLEAIRREAPDATEDDATSPPLETRRGGARDTKVKGARSSNGGPRDTGAQQKDYNQTRKKEYNEEAVESERTRSKSNEHSRKSSSTTTEPPTQPPETGRTLTELEQFVLEKLAPWSADIGDVRDVIETLQVFNLGDRDIRQYVSERRVDFSNRKRELSRGEVLRYLASRQDLIDYGYTQPIEPVQKRRRQKERQEDADGRRDSWETDAPSQEEPPSDEEDDSTWKPRTAPREQPDEMDDFFEQCREQLRGEVVDEYVEGVLFFDGIEERIVEFETEAPFRCLEVHEKYRNEIEAAAREVWTEVEGVRLLFEGEPIGE